MGKHAAEAVQVLQDSSGAKVHASMCLELEKVVNRVEYVLPAIESAQPGCSSGIQELCSLSNTIEKAKLLLLQCAESSKLYLAITGEATLLRCERIRSALYHSLTQVQSMVPELLAAQITEIVNYIGGARFFIDPKDEEAGRVMIELLQQTDVTAESLSEAFQFVALKLNITSSKALLIEKRCIRKLMDKFHDTDPKKEGILRFFLYFLKNGKKLSPDVDEQKENNIPQGKILKSNSKSECSASNTDYNNKLTAAGETDSNLSSIDSPPVEFLCPISLKIMFDPVIIASGKTYERFWIEKWFDEGHSTSPTTQKNLVNLSMVPNSCMKELISNWCRAHNINVQDPYLQVGSTKLTSWESSHSDSICSLGNVSPMLLEGKAGDYILQRDHSNVSLISSDCSCCSHSSLVKGTENLSNNHALKFPWNNDYQNCQSFSKFNLDMYINFFRELSELPQESQGKAVADVKILVDINEVACFMEALVAFMKNAHDLSDVQAQQTGAHILLEILSKLRDNVQSLGEDAFHLLTMFLDSKIQTDALMIMEILSCHPIYLPKIVASGILPAIADVLDSEDTEIHELAVNVICNLSVHREVRSHILSSQCISKLVPLISKRKLAENCIKIMRNLSDMEEGALMIAETNGCIASIVELLDYGSREEQEHAVVILHSLCLHSLDYRLLVMNHGVIPALCNISLNGTSKGKECSMKLLLFLRELRDSDCLDQSESSDSWSSANSKPVEGVTDLSSKSQPTSNPSSGFFGRKFRFLLKSRTVASS